MYKAEMLLDGSLKSGALPSTQLKLVRDWVHLHQAALVVCWEQAWRGENPNTIPPLE
jgi:hypothetical protein